MNDLINGFGGENSDGVAALQKAMQAGQITGRDTTNQSLTGEPLKVESLEASVKRLEFRMEQIKLFNLMPKLDAYNTVEEFLQLESYGTQGGGFYNEGELSDVADSNYIRRAEKVKYIQVTGEVTVQSQMVKSYIDMLKTEQNNKIMWVLRTANQGLTNADSKIVPQQWNSLYAQHKSVGTSSDSEFLWASLEDYYNDDVVIDLRGESLKQTNIEEAAIIVDQNNGLVSHLVAPPKVVSTVSQDFFQRQRIMMNAGNPGGYSGAIGTVAKSIPTSVGDVGLVQDKFTRRHGDVSDNGKTTVSAATSSKAPNAPTTGGAPNVTADTSAKFVAGDAGTVYYAVTAVNRFGESALTVLDASAVTIAVGSAVDLSFTPTSGTQTATGFRIYRTEVTSAATAAEATFYPLFEVSAAERVAGYDGGSAGVVRDRGRLLPNTEEAFLTEMNVDVLSFKQLAPISKLDLATISMSKRFITFLFGMPNLYAPKKMVKFVNCGKRLTTSS